MREISQDPELWKRYRAEWLRAQEAGALFLGPGATKGKVYNFAGARGEFVEDEVYFQKELRYKLLCVDKRMEAEAAIAEARKKLPDAAALGRRRA